jgi:hypothetical protein
MLRLQIGTSFTRGLLPVCCSEYDSLSDLPGDPLNDDDFAGTLRGAERSAKLERVRLWQSYVPTEIKGERYFDG